MAKERCRNEKSYVARDEKGRAKAYVNPTREEYLSEDRQCIYRVEEYGQGKTRTVELFRVGVNGITEKDIEMLAELYQQEDQFYFDQKRLTGKRHIVEDKEFGAPGTISGTVTTDEDDVFYKAFPQYRQKSANEKRLALIGTVAHRVLKGRRLYIYIQHIECGRTLKDIAEELNAKSDKPVSESAIDNVWYRIVDRLCRELGVERHTIRHNEE